MTENYKLLRDHPNDANPIIAQTLRQDPSLVNFLKSSAAVTAAAIIVGTIVEDFATIGGGIYNDWQSFWLAYRIVRFAWLL